MTYWRYKLGHIKKDFFKQVKYVMEYKINSYLHLYAAFSVVVDRTDSFLFTLKISGCNDIIELF